MIRLYKSIFFKIYTWKLELNMYSDYRSMHCIDRNTHDLTKHIWIKFHHCRFKKNFINHVKVFFSN